jgi:Ca2+-binding RTX toxin-like protein
VRPSDAILVSLANVKNLKGKEGKDTLIGPLFGFGTILAGGNGADRLTGGLGRDTLVGGNGVDHMSGGGGRDLYNAIDNLRDFIFNRPGDIVGSDSFDVKSIP